MKLRFSPDKLDETLADFLSFLKLVNIANDLRVVTADPDDDRVLECAVLGGATHIVTGDRRHLLPLSSFRGSRIVTPAEFLDFVRIP